MRNKKDGAIELNIDLVREDLVRFYKMFIKDKNDYGLIDEVKEYDGFWSCDILLPEDVARAVTNLVYFYVEPKLTREAAEEILKALHEEGSERKKKD